MNLILKSPENFNADYARVFRHRIKAKTAQLHSELALLDGSTGITENCNGVTEFCNGNQGLNQCDFRDRMVGLPGFEPGSATREAAILSPLIRSLSKV